MRTSLATSQVPAGPASSELRPLVLEPAAVARALALAALLFVLVSTVGQLVKFLTGHDEVMGLVSLTYVDHEGNLPTVFSALLLAAASAALTLAAATAWRNRAPDVSRWAILALGFLYLAFDEGAALHERLRAPLFAFLGHSAEAEGSEAYWVIRALGAMAVLVLVFGKFLLRLPVRTRRTFVIGGALYFAGAAGLDIVGRLWALSHGVQNLTYVFFATLEESLELAGVIVLIYGVLAYVGETWGEIRLTIGDAAFRPDLRAARIRGGRVDADP